MRLAYWGAAVFVILSALFGQERSDERMICPGETIALDTSSKSQPFVRMRLGAKEGNFLIDTRVDRSFVNSKLYDIPPGEKVTDKRNYDHRLIAADSLTAEISMPSTCCTRPVKAAETVIDRVTGEIAAGDQAVAFCSRSRLRFQFQGRRSPIRLAG